MHLAQESCERAWRAVLYKKVIPNSNFDGSMVKEINQQATIAED